mgnify:FL=1|jgi:hypothetical protein|nr:MAG TPA: hypothetical protein [Caudoviricetes sp.]
MKCLVMEGYFTHLSLEDIQYKQEYDIVPLYGDFAAMVADKLNAVFRKESEKKEEVKSLGSDIDDKSTQFNYGIRKELITAYDNTATMKSPGLTVENAHFTDGVGLYNIIYDVAGMVKGMTRPIVYTVKDNLIDTETVEKLDALIKAGHQIVLIIALDDANKAVDDIRIQSTELFDLMRNEPSNIAVYAAYTI